MDKINAICIIKTINLVVPHMSETNPMIYLNYNNWIVN